MKKLLILASISALLAGCASHNVGGTGAGAYGGVGSGAGTPTTTTSSAPTAATPGAPITLAPGERITIGPGGPGTTTPGGAQMSTTHTDVDSRFIQQAAQSGMAEVKMGQLIVQKAQSPDLRSYGQHLIDDHTRADQQLAQIAAQKKVTFPTRLDATQQQAIDHLATLSGTEFDQTAAANAVQDHQQAIQLYEQAAKNLQDPDLKAFAQQNLPMLQEHLAMARQLQAATSTAQGGVGQ